MIVYEVIPHLGIGPVRLGMRRDEVRRIMPGPVEPFLKGPDAVVETDGFHDCAFQVHYGRDMQTVEYIELCSAEEFRAVYRGMDVFATPADELAAHVSSHAKYDETDWELGYSYVFTDLDLSLWRPVLPESAQDEEGRFFSTIGVGVVGYYRA